MAVDSLQLQIASALQRFANLQRRIDAEAGQSPKLLSRAVEDLEKALEEIQVAQDQLIENRLRLEQLQAELARERERYWRLFDEMPQPYVVTRPDSAILEVNKAASDLLNVSQRFLVGKTLSVFVCEDRARFLTETARVMNESAPMELMLRVRPRERAPLDVSARVTGDGISLRWILQPVAAAPSAQLDRVTV
jgi:PAS domain S-box-containing protein